MQRHSSNATNDSQVHDLDSPSEVIDEREIDDDHDEDPPPLGDPFALAVGCDLLKTGPGVPGCWASIACDCGRRFKVDLLTELRKPCPGCGIVFSHCLLIGPADDSDLTDAFLDTIHGEPDDDDDQGDDDLGHNAGPDDAHEQHEQRPATQARDPYDQSHDE